MSRSQKDILIVEDSQPERERLRKLFHGVGYTVVACSEVGAAEVELENTAFRLAILDIGLNDKSGSLLFEELRRGHKQTSVVIFTGNPSPSLKQRFADSGAADYIVKASSRADNNSFLTRVSELIGAPDKDKNKLECIPLGDFVAKYVSPESAEMFLEVDGALPSCNKCRGANYIVSFGASLQTPSNITAKVVCEQCGDLLNLEVKN